MIISSAPMRISLNGGGSDLPAYTRHHDGCVVAMPLNKRVYITFHESFSRRFRISYSKMEDVTNIHEIEHPIIRACLQYVGWDGPALEIHSVADVPGTGTGLGSSSAFTVALLAGLLHLQSKSPSTNDLAKMASHVELNILQSPIGYQDQYACALADINSYRFFGSGLVSAEPVFHSQNLKKRFIEEFNKSFMFFHLDLPRSTNEILLLQNQKIVNIPSSLETLSMMVELAQLTTESIRELRIEEVGRLMTVGWKLKSSLNNDNNNPLILNLMTVLDALPIYGTKLLGAGGGGFLAVLANPKYHKGIRSKLLKLVREYPAAIEIAPPFVQKVGSWQ